MENLRASPYFAGVATAVVIYLVLFFSRNLLLSQKNKIINRSLKRADDYIIFSLAHTTHLFMLVTALYIGFQFFPEHKIYPTWSFRIFFITLMFQIAIWSNYFVRKWMQVSFHIRRRRDPASATSLSIVEFISKMTIWTLLLLTTLNNLGIEVTTMIAGLGIGGIAVALALQNVLGDLFSSLSIILDKPFVVGDFIILGEWLGEVEKIGLKTTRIRSLGGEQIIMSNSDLLSSRIRNMKRMHERRVATILSLSHEASIEDLKKTVQIITNAVKKQNRVRFERCHFMKVNIYSLDIETIYWVLSDDYDLYMDIQQEILFEVYKALKEEEIALGYPVQSLKVGPIQVGEGSSKRAFEVNQQNPLS